MSNWNTHVDAWSAPPIDDVGYLRSIELLKLSDDKLRAIIDRMRVTRYEGWRNTANLWRDVMGLDSLKVYDVLDFGCGSGIEALELARLGNRVSVADISLPNVQLAERVLHLYDYDTVSNYVISDHYPYVIEESSRFDIFHCNGVLHHCRWPRQIMERAHELLRPGGEVRLMVYSDIGWRIATQTEPPENVEESSHFNQFVRFFDAVGTYADWYDHNRIVERFGDIFNIERCIYLTHDQRYLGVVLRRK